MQPDQLVDHRQADARPFVSSAAGAFDAVETLEELGDVVRVLESVTVMAPWNVNLRAFESRFITICSHIARST